MAFSNSDSITATDMNNLLRGLHRNNANTAHTGSTAETDLSSFTLTGGTMTATGMLYIQAVGSSSGTAGTKTIRLYFGTNVNDVLTIPAANTDDWFFEAWVYNTDSTTQRIVSRTARHVSGGGAETTDSNVFTTAAEDTTANVTIKATVTLANAGDTVTQHMFNIFVCQIT